MLGRLESSYPRKPTKLLVPFGTKSEKRLHEDFVVESVAKHLRKGGWSKNLKVVLGNAPGPDLRVTNSRYPRSFIVEAKGDPGPKVKSPRSSREASFNSALGQILSRIKVIKGNARYKYSTKYGVAFPDSFRGIVLRRLPWAVCDKLNLYLFLIDDHGRVDQYDWRRLREFQLEAKR